MVDADRVGTRLDRLEHLIERLGGVRERGEAAYLADEGLRAMTERWLQRLAQAARQRNLLVHAYLDVDDRQVFAALDRLDDLRAFAAALQRVADAG